MLPRAFHNLFLLFWFRALRRGRNMFYPGFSGCSGAALHAPWTTCERIMFDKYFSLSEARRLYSVGLPIFIAQLSQTGMTFADTAFAGQYSAEHMAAGCGRQCGCLWPCWA